MRLSEERYIKTLIHNLEDKIMTAVNDFASAQNAFNDQMTTAINGIQAGINALGLSAADQASLDALKVRGQTIADSLTALAKSVTPVTTPTA